MLIPPRTVNVDKTARFVITGSLSNIQNADGIRYFIDELYPLIPANEQIIIAGKSPTIEIKELLVGKPNITLVDSPDDIDREVRRAEVLICATRLGSGIKVRITDGFRNGIPVISHRVSARGYDDFVKHGWMFVFNTSDEFAVCLKQYRETRNKINNREIEEYYFNNYSLDAGIKRLRRFILG